MIDIKNKLCPCGKQPIFGYNNQQPICCDNCRKENMLDVRNIKKLCKANNEGISCSQRGNNKYNGYCTHCFANLFPNDPLTAEIRTNSKEIKVRNYINENFEGFQHDKSIWTANCECTHRRRIDHIKLIGNTLLCIETDENQHKYYNKMDEYIRYSDVMMIHGGKFIFIRFNPPKTLSARYFVTFF